MYVNDHIGTRRGSRQTTAICQHAFEFCVPSVVGIGIVSLVGRGCDVSQLDAVFGECVGSDFFFFFLLDFARASCNSRGL